MSILDDVVSYLIHNPPLLVAVILLLTTLIPLYYNTRAFFGHLPLVRPTILPSWDRTNRYLTVRLELQNMSDRHRARLKRQTPPLFQCLMYEISKLPEWPFDEWVCRNCKRSGAGDNPNSCPACQKADFELRKGPALGESGHLTSERTLSEWVPFKKDRDDGIPRMAPTQWHPPIEVFTSSLWLEPKEKITIERLYTCRKNDSVFKLGLQVSTILSRRQKVGAWFRGITQPRWTTTCIVIRPEENVAP